VELCETQRELANTINYGATRTIARSAREMNAFVVYVSTDYVFDGEKGMYRETDDPSPINFYGFSKLKGEQAIRDLLSDYLIARSSVIYGSVPASGKMNFALWLLDVLGNGKSATVVTDQYVSPTLNTNLAEMILDAIDRRITGTLHLAGASRVSRYEFALCLCKEWGLRSSLLQEASMRSMKWVAKRPRDSSLDVSKAMTSLRIKPLTVSESLKTLRREMGAGD